MKKVLLSFFILIYCLGWCAVDYGPKYLSPTTEIITPHIQWLKPYSNGTLKILFITHRLGMREVVEIYQRMDIQYDVFCISRPNIFWEENPHNPDTLTMESMIEDGEKKLSKDYDMIVLGNIDWSVLPSQLRYQILKKVKGGTTLLGKISGVDEYLKRAMTEKVEIESFFLFPYKGLPQFSKYQDFKSFLTSSIDIFRFGDGKIMLLKGYSVPSYIQVLTPLPIGNPLYVKYIEYDYHLAFICHLLLYGSKKEPSIKIKGKDYIIIERKERLPIEFVIESKERKGINYRCIVRNKDNEIFFSENKGIDLSSGDTRLLLEIGRLPCGSYFVDIWVEEGKKILNFGSSYLEVVSDTKIGKVDIKRHYKKEEDISGTITIENKSADWEGTNLKILQKDRFGRITNKKDISLSNIGESKKEISFSLPATKPLSIIQHLEISLCKEKEILDKQLIPFSISNLYPEEDIRYILWTDIYHSTYLSYYFYEHLYKSGVDTQYTGFTEVVPLANMYHIPYAIRFIDKKTDFYPQDVPHRTKDDHIRMPCLNDPQYLKEVEQILTKRAERVFPFSTIEFSMGDECHFVAGNYELCFCDWCVKGFHRFLKQEYESVDNMNREYGTNYTSFEEVKPVTLEEAKKDKRVIPLWVDYRIYMEDVWAGIYKFSRDVIQRVVPEAKTGYEGSDSYHINSFIAADFYKLMEVMKLNCIYDGQFIPFAVSHFSQPGTLLGLGWYGGYNRNRSEIFQRYIPWRHLLRGANSFWIWHGQPGALGSVISGDISFYDFFKSNIEEVKEIKRGIGKLLINSKRDNDKIAVLYSASSVHISTLTPEFPSMEKVLNSLATIFEDSNFQFQVISYKELKEGVLNKGDFSLLILPFAQSLSKEEIEEIYNFVENGGVVIADLRPGVCNQHGKPYIDGGVDKIFGIKQDTVSYKAHTGRVSIKVKDKFPEILAEVVSDSSLKLTTGQPLAEIGGNIPGIIVNRYGKGTGILLNFSLSRYRGDMKKKEPEEAENLMKFFKSLISFAGIKEKIKMTPDILGVRSYRFKSGELEYIGILQELPEPPINYAKGTAKPITPSSINIKLDKKYHIYNTREGKYLGYIDKIDTSVEPGKAQLYSLLPYKIEEIELTVPDKISQGKELVYEIEIKGKEQVLGTHIIRSSLISPEDEEIHYYSKNIKIERGKGQGIVPLSLNEKVGVWKLRVTDIASGVSKEKKFIIQEVKK